MKTLSIVLFLSFLGIYLGGCVMGNGNVNVMINTMVPVSALPGLP